MIKKLRLKLIIMMMSVVSIILLVIFFTIFISTHKNIERNGRIVLEDAFKNKNMFNTPVIPHQPYDKPYPNSRIPIILAETIKEGTSRIILNQIHYISDSEINKAINLAINNKNVSGKIKEYELRFLKHHNENFILISFADTSVETRIIRNLLRNSFFIGAGSLVAFFMLSLFLSKWAIKPVEEAWENQKQFIADASHELKTPLTVVISNTDMLISNIPYLDKKNIQRFDNIKFESIRMKKLIENMLLLARSDFLKQSNNFTNICISDITLNSILLFESSFYDDEKYLDYQIKENIMMNGDPEKLRQLIDILLDNANKYTERNQHIQIKLSLLSKKSILLSVSNEGVPILENELKNIFRRFYRVDKSRENHGGFGLGLSIAHNIVMAHKGKIWAESSQTGNIFYVLFSHSVIK